MPTHTTIRMSANDLKEFAVACATDEQRAMMSKLFGMGWRVQRTRELPNAGRKPVITLDAPGGAVGALYPDGKFSRNSAVQKKIRINLEWAKPGDWTF